MATLSTAAKNAAIDAVTVLLDAGSAAASGSLVLMTAGNAEVATIVLSNPAFAAASGGSASVNSTTADTNTTAGTVTQYKAVNRDGTTVWSGSASELTLTTAVYGTGDTATLTSWTLSI